MALRHIPGFSVSEAVWAEVKDELAVVWKRPESQVDDVAELINCLDVRICSTEKRECRLGFKSEEGKRKKRRFVFTDPSV